MSGARKLSGMVKRIVGRLERFTRSQIRYVRAQKFGTYQMRSPLRGLSCGRFAFMTSGFFREMASLSPGHVELIVQLAEDALHHRFNLLGSGLVEVRHGMRCKGMSGVSYDAPSREIDVEGAWLDGIINMRNRADAKRIWRLLDPEYRAIDWQIDFKSGYRWQEKDWHGKIRFGHLPGVDVKVPWELSRMQHLPVLALAAGYVGAGLSDVRNRDEYVREVRNQILDFVATNPPGFGVNWCCSMDVAIRISNMVVAFDILVSIGVHFDPEFKAAFADNVYAHARHVAENLEWSAVYRGNHYLADLAGLLFASSYLDDSKEADEWLCFATAEIMREIEYQFHADGSNFEASTCYHRLSAEIVLWACALLDNLPPERLKVFKTGTDWRGPLPPPHNVAPLMLHPVPGRSHLSPLAPWCRDRLEKMASFTREITRDNGLVVQFGDNDSGRFITMGTTEQMRSAGDPTHMAWSLDHRSLVAGVEAYQGRNSVDAASRLLAAFAGRIGPAATPSGSGLYRKDRVGTDVVWTDFLEVAEKVPPRSKWNTEYEAPPSLRDELELTAFPGMGCYVMRSPRLFLAIRCGEIGIRGLGAHAHCDQLAIDLMIDGENRVLDPGTYIYTADARMRNLYRSVRAHHAPRHADIEPANLSLGLFDLRGAAEGECLFFGKEGFLGKHMGYGFAVYRMIRILDDRISVLDFSLDGHEVTDPTPDKLMFSPSYGYLLRN